ncbi:MAG: YjbQ family protein [Chloroflexi bacterium]|nr:YjbQ family protein [Chloroflexota bacterium]
MKTYYEEIHIITEQETEIINISNTVHSKVKDSGIKDGMVFILSKHTTSAITVNEGLPDIESDLKELIQRLVPDEYSYHHARYLHSDGQMAINAPCHLRSALLGFEVFFPLNDGKIITGGRQNIYFVELDGPQERTYCIKIMGNA